MINIQAEGLDDLQRALRHLASDQIPTALRNAINDTARDVMKREEQEIARVFDRPTRIVQKPFYVRPATKEDLTAEVRLKDKLQGGPIENTLKPHIPGFSPNRSSKGIEIALRAKGLVRSDEYLVPSRTMKLDQYGNITRAMAKRMIADVGATGGNRTYMWGEITPQSGRPIRGIWHLKRFQGRKPNALMMLAVSRPSYTKRFSFYDVGRREIERVMPRHAQTALEFALRRAGAR